MMPKPTIAEMTVMMIREMIEPRKIITLLYLIARMAEKENINFILNEPSQNFISYSFDAVNML